MNTVFIPLAQGLS